MRQQSAVELVRRGHLQASQQSSLNISHLLEKKSLRDPSLPSKQKQKKYRQTPVSPLELHFRKAPNPYLSPCRKNKYSPLPPRQSPLAYFYSICTTSSVSIGVGVGSAVSGTSGTAALSFGAGDDAPVSSTPSAFAAGEGTSSTVCLGPACNITIGHTRDIQ